MDKVSWFWSLAFVVGFGLGLLAWLGSIWIELGKFMLALRLALSRQIVSSYQIHGLRILGARSVWEARNCWKEPYDIKASGCNLSSYYLI